MDTRGDFTKQIMDFRTTYLRAVARASVDLPFRQELTQPGNAFGVLRKAFDYDCPWSLTLKLCDNYQKGPRLNPASGRVMTLPYWGEALTIYIPRKPVYESSVPYEVQVRNQLDALAAYYNQNTWLLQNKLVATAPSQPVATLPSQTVATAPSSLGHVDPPPVFERKWSEVSKTDRYALGDDVNDFISFAAAIFNAVALAWQDQLMWNELTAYKGEETQTRARTITILKEWLGYNYPWELDLVIKEDTSAKYIPYTESDGGKNAGQWIHTTPPELMLTLPWMSGVDINPDIQPGDSDEEKASKIKAAMMEASETEVAVNQKNPGLAIMGLALYNTNGPGYPFTCG